MKKFLLGMCLCYAALNALAQDASRITGNVHVHDNANLTFFGPLHVTSSGLLRNEDGNLYTRDSVSGEDKIQMDLNANLDIDNGSFSFTNETDEEFNNLKIGTTGHAVVVPRNSLTVSGDLNNTNNTSTDAGIKLKANSSGYAQLMTPGTVTSKGQTYAEQYFTASTNPGWRQISSPVLTTLADIGDDFEIHYAGATNPSPNVIWFDASPKDAGQGTGHGPDHDGPASAKYWTEASASSEPFGPINHAPAYNLFVGNGQYYNFSIYNGGVLDLTGEFGNGNYTFHCYQTHDKGPNYDGSLSDNEAYITGWNLIPNTYPSNIDVSDLLADADFDVSYKNIHVWDGKTQQYIVFSNDVNSTIDWNTGDNSCNGCGGNAAHTYPTTNNIAPFQAFWVKTYDASLSGSANGTADHDIVLKNSHRTIDDNANYFKQTPPTIALRTWESLRKFKDQTLLVFDAGYNNGFDQEDGLKLKNTEGDVPSIASVIDDLPININRLSIPAPHHSIPISFDSKFDGMEYNIAMALSDVNPDWTIYLEDRKFGTMNNLRNFSIYSFIHDQSFKGNRFIVHINKVPGNIDPTSWNNISIYANNDGINVAFANPELSTAEVLITNTIGQVIYQGTVSTGYTFTYPINDDLAAYVVHVVSGHQIRYDKIIK